jgi:hypothetical protein
MLAQFIITKVFDQNLDHVAYLAFAFQRQSGF